MNETKEQIERRAELLRKTSEPNPALLQAELGDVIEWIMLKAPPDFPILSFDSTAEAIDHLFALLLEAADETE